MTLNKAKNSVEKDPVLAEKDQFIIKLAENEQEIEDACRLRYRVFKLERGNGVNDTAAAGIDRDDFDDVCKHLVIIEKNTRKVVGTYRMQFGSDAMRLKGFYSGTEYDLSGINKIASQAIEVGRSCVDPEYRSGSVVSLLWAGIAEIMLRTKMMYLLGCVSLEEVDYSLGWALSEYFKCKGLNSDIVLGKAKQDYVLPEGDEERIRELLDDERQLRKALPPLLKGYIRLGAHVCGEPALDRDFGTIDYLICLNLSNLPKRYQKHYLEK